MSWENPIRALMNECEAALALDAADVGGRVAEHVYGKKGLAGHGTAPRYVWLPTRAREEKTGVTQAVTDVPQVASFHQHFEIHCWGANDAQMWAMVNNVIRAVDKALAADCRFENGRDAHPSEAWNQSGELYIVELSVLVPIVDAYIGLTDLEDPESENVLPTAGTAVAYLTDDLEVDGEAGPAIDVDEDDLT